MRFIRKTLVAAIGAVALAGAVALPATAAAAATRHADAVRSHLDHDFMVNNNGLSAMNAILANAATHSTSTGRELGVTGATLVSVGGIMMAAPAADAAPRSCVFTSGTAGVDVRSQPADGTIFTKQNDSCHDFNLSSVGTSADYVGWLFHSSTGRWSSCSEGDVFIPKGGHGVLCSGVLAGTKMVATAAGHYSITAEY